MDIQELFDMAKAANTKAKIRIFMSEETINIRWIHEQSLGSDWYRTLPMSALGSDRDPYRAVREYIKMDAMHMEGRGGVPDRTHPMFQTTAPAASTLPVLTVTPADLLPGDIVEVRESPTGKEVVKGVSIFGINFEVCWVSGERATYSHTDKLRIIRRGRRHDN